MTSQSIERKFVTQAIDRDGFTVEIRANISTTFEYQWNPYDAEPGHQHHGSGWYMGDITWSDIQIDDMVDRPETPASITESDRLTRKVMEQVQSEAVAALNEEFETQN